MMNLLFFSFIKVLLEQLKYFHKLSGSPSFIGLNYRDCIKVVSVFATYCRLFFMQCLSNPCAKAEQCAKNSCDIRLFFFPLAL